MKKRDTGGGIIRFGVQLSLVVAGLVACGLATAQQTGVHPALQDRWSFQAGAFVPKVDTNASLNGSGGRIGTTVNFEDELNLTDRKTMPAILGSVRLGERWRIEAEYMSLHRGGSRAVNRSINWGDNTYAIGTVVTSEFNSDIYRLSGGYSFIKDNKQEFGLALGLHVTEFKTSLAAAGVGANSNDTLAPLPTIGLYGAYAFTPQWLLSGRLDYFSMDSNDYDGSLVNFNLGVDYRFTRSFGVGVAFRHVDYDVKVTKTRYNGGINYKFNGPMFYAVTSF